MSAIVANLREWFDIVAIKKCILDIFEIDERNVSIESEVMAGYIHFISCLYVFPVVPGQLSDAGYDKTSSIEATALACGIGCLLSAYITNLPFVIAPPTSVSIYLAVSLQQMNLNRIQGDSVVMLSGCALLCVGIFKPVTALVTRLIPDCIQASTAVGIGLITAVAGAIELDLVIPGKYTIVEMGPITPAIIIALATTILIVYASHVKHYKAAYFIGLMFGTVAWWWYHNDWPDTIMRIPKLTVDRGVTMDFQLLGLLANLLFLYILTLSGLARSMSDLAQLTHPVEETIPRGQWLFIICGIATILSGYFSGPPILLSPETAAGIKAGAKTGLSTLVCGLLFLITIFFCPLFSHVPATGTSPLLLLVGLTLFTNTNRIKWTHAPDAIPAFFVLLLIPFTYSILSGVGVGYALYIGIAMVAGEGMFSWRSVMNSITTTSTTITNSSGSSNNNSFSQYCNIVQISWSQWKMLFMRCIHATTHCLCPSALTASLASANNDSNSNSNSSNNSSVGSSNNSSDAHSLLVRLSHCLRAYLHCFWYGVAHLCCWVTCGGFINYVLGGVDGEEDHGNVSSKVNSQLLHHHPFALHQHNVAVTAANTTSSLNMPNHNLNSNGPNGNITNSLDINSSSSNNGSSGMSMGYLGKLLYRRGSDDYHPDDDSNGLHNDNHNSSSINNNEEQRRQLLVDENIEEGVIYHQ